MKLPTGRLTRRLDALAGRIRALGRTEGPCLSRYRDDPIGYARDVLGVTLWDPIADALKGLIAPPFMVSIDSGHGVGKTFAAAVAVNWWYDTRNPSWTISTAPTSRDIKDLLWTEVRLQRQRARIRLPDDLMPAAAEMRSGPEHVAKGYTARDANSAHGRHRPNMLFIFDEKEGVPPAFWDGMKSMFRPWSGDAVLVIGNPLTTNSRAYFEHKSAALDGSPKWKRVRLSSLDHPNVAAGLAGQRGELLPVPGAVTAEQVDQWMADWCDPVAPGDERPTDITWRGRVYRPGPIGEPRILGLRPTAGTYGIWSEAMFALTLRSPPAIPDDALPTVGCDCAQFGDDYTAIHTRAGPVSLRHQAGNGWDHLKVADRLRDEAALCATWANDRRPVQADPVKPTDIPIVLDDDATGRAVSTVLRQGEYRVIEVNASSNPHRQDLYPSARSELWFQARNKTAVGQVNLSLIGHAERQRLEQQLLAPLWTPDLAGRRMVEPKKATKKLLGRSPDDADAFNLSYYETSGVGSVATWVETDAPARRELFG